MSNTYKNLILSTIFVSCYLFVEWIYNQHLLTLLTYDYISPEDFEFTEFFGKTIASIGLNLIVNSFLKKNSFINFFIRVIIGYIVLTYAFNYAVNAFPDDFRHSSYYSMLYRKDVINQNDDLTILKFTDDTVWYEKSLVISQFVYTLKDKQWHEFENKIKEPISEKINKLNNNREKYFKNYQNYNTGIDKINKAWEKYSDAQFQYNRYRHYSVARKKFIQKTGLPPDLSFNDFVRKVAPEFKKHSETKLFEGSKEAKISPIYVKDIPPKLPKSQFNDYVDSEIKRVTTQIAPEIDNIRENKQSFDTLAILVIPPISICLSLFSIIFNILVLIAKWIHVFCKLKFSPSVFSTLFVILFGCIILFSASMKTTLTETDNYWKDLKDKNYQEHPLVYGSFSIGLKLEPIICPENQFEFVKNFTDIVYKKKNYTH